MQNTFSESVEEERAARAAPPRSEQIARRHPLPAHQGRGPRGSRMGAATAHRGSSARLGAQTGTKAARQPPRLIHLN